MKLDLTVSSLEENLGIIVASLPACRRLVQGDLLGTRIRSLLSRFTSSTKQISLAKSRSINLTEQENGADELMSLKNIHVTNSLEVQSAARTPSDCEMGHGSRSPDGTLGLETFRQTMVEKV